MSRGLGDVYKRQVEVGTGYVRAMVGGRGQDQFNRAVQMVRQPGSAFKPFVYLTAFANRVNISDSLSNEAKDFGGGWTPKNYGGTSGGKTIVSEALIHSMNIPTVYLADQVGIRKIIETAKACGISTLVTDGPYNDINLAAALGGLTNGVSVWDMAKAYSVFANGGRLVEPRIILKVVDRSGNVLEDKTGTSESKQVVDEKAAWKLTSVLEEVISRGTGGNAYIGREAAGKTGTTDGEHDAWFAGYTANLSTAVWIGDDASTNAGYTGGTIPALIWRDYMSRAENTYRAKRFDIPASVAAEIAKARAEKEKQEKEEKKKKEEEEKKKKKKELGDKIKAAGNKILDKIAGHSSSEKQ